MIYFDNAASSEINPEIIRLYTNLLTTHYANQGSSHKAGLAVNHRVNQSRQLILKCLKLDASYQVVFTSGATEANNLFLKGSIAQYLNRGKRVITSAGEHDSVLKPLLRLKEELGIDLVILPLTKEGTIAIEDLKRHLDHNTILVSIMAVNNETGAITDCQSIRSALKPFPKCLYHADVTQALAKIELDYKLFDAITFSAHKINGLKGSGALVLKKSLTLKPLFDGGTYEEGLRQGTPDSPKNIVLADTIQLALKHYQNEKTKMRLIKDKLFHAFGTQQDVVINSPYTGSDYIFNFSLQKHRASVVAQGLSQSDVMVSTTSACSSKTHQESHVIQAMFADEHRAHEVLRLSFSAFTTLNEVEQFLQIYQNLIEDLHHE